MVGISSKVTDKVMFVGISLEITDECENKLFGIRLEMRHKFPTNFVAVGMFHVFL